MFVVNTKTKAVALTPGDSAYFTITLVGDDIPFDGTDVVFTVKEEVGGRPLLVKHFSVDSGVVHIELQCSETRRLKPGRFAWDIRILYSKEDVYTPMIPALFQVLEVVGDA